MLALALILVSAATVVVGAPLDIEPHIVGGNTTTIENYPHQVSLRVDGEHYCGGSIINKKHVVTALHCVEGVKPSAFKVAAGITKQSEEVKQLYSVESIAKFDTNGSEYDGDVAVLKLENAITFGPKVQPIALVPENEEPLPGDVLTTIGWGTTSEYGKPSDVLREVQVPTVDREACRTAYKRVELEITERMLCAGEEGKDHCYADSGGPIINEKKQLVGVASFAEDCARRNYPGVNVNIAHPEINQFIVKNSEE